MTTKMTPVNVRSAVVEDLCAHGDEFFGLEVVRYSPATLERRLDELGVCLMHAAVDDVVVGVAGYAVNPANHRQATVSVSAFNSEHIGSVLRALVHLLHRAARTGSFISVLRANSAAVNVNREFGFAEVGRLRKSRYHRSQYHDEVVLHYELKAEVGGYAHAD
jgi:RimJ/RimL family protein N-acetyltransferase